MQRDANYVITHVIVPKQNGGPGNDLRLFEIFVRMSFVLDSCDTEKEEEMVEYMANYDLITLGWIHVCIQRLFDGFSISYSSNFRHIQPKQHSVRVLIFIRIYPTKCSYKKQLLSSLVLNTTSIQIQFFFSRSLLSFLVPKSIL